MESAAKILQRHQQQQPPPPLSVIMERSAEDSNASASRPGSSASIRSNNTNGTTDRDRRYPVQPQQARSTENIHHKGAAFDRMYESSFSKRGGDSFTSLSESQARDLFDNDAKDRIEFLAVSDEFQPQDIINASSANVNESLGVYFMRRSSHPVKGISDESAIFNSNIMDGTFPADFDNTRSLSASTPLPDRSLMEESARRETGFEDDESVMDQPNFVANESIVALYDFFKGPQSDGKRKDSMIDYVLEYCNKLKPETQRPQPQALPQTRAISASVPTLPKVPRSPVKLNIGSKHNAMLNQSTTSSVTSFAKPTPIEHKSIGGSRLVRQVTRSQTQLNLSIHEKSLVVHKKANQSSSKPDLQSRQSQLPIHQPGNSQGMVQANNQNYQNLYAPPQCPQYYSYPPQPQSTQITTQANVTAGSYSSSHPPQYPVPPYGPPIVIQVYCPYPGQGYPTPAQMQMAPGPGQSYYTNAPSSVPQIMPSFAQPQFQQYQPSETTAQPQQADQTQQQTLSMPSSMSHQLSCEPRVFASTPEKRKERADGLCEYKENVPVEDNFPKPDLTVDKLAVVWEGCNVGGYTVEKLTVFNKGNLDMAIKCTFTDSEPGIYTMFVKAHSAGFIAASKTIVKAGCERIFRVAFRPKTGGRAEGKLRMEIHPILDQEKNKAHRLSFVSCIPLVGFGYGHNESCLV